MRAHTAGLVAAGVAAASLLIVPTVSGLDGKLVGRPGQAASSSATSATSGSPTTTSTVAPRRSKPGRRAGAASSSATTSAPGRVTPGRAGKQPGEPDIKTGRPGRDYSLPALTVNVQGPVVAPVPGSRDLTRSTSRSGQVRQEALTATARRAPEAVLAWYRDRLGRLGFGPLEVPVEAGTEGAGFRRGEDSVTVVASRAGRATTTYSLLATLRSSGTP